MNIMENKRVAAIALLMAVAFGGVCYYGYGRYAELKENLTKIDEVNSEIQSYAKKPIPPKAKYRDQITQAAKDAKQLSDNLHTDLLRYASFCVAGQGTQSGEPVMKLVDPPTGVGQYMPVSQSSAFQANLRKLSAALVERAKEAGCTLGAPGQTAGSFNVAKFGNLSSFDTTAAAKEEEVPYLNFLIFAGDDVMRHIIDAGAPSINRIYFHKEPMGEVRKGDSMMRLGIEVAFTAKRSDLVNPELPDTHSVLPQVINKLTHDSRFFFIPTAVAVVPTDAGKDLPENDLALLDVVDNTQTEADEQDEAANEPADKTKAAAPLLGKPDETVEVFISLQVLYFPNDKF